MRLHTNAPGSTRARSLASALRLCILSIIAALLLLGGAPAEGSAPRAPLLAAPAAAEMTATNGLATLVKQINTTNTTQSSGPGNLAVVGSLVYFSASTPLTGGELWKTDGTAVGTALVKDIVPDSRGTSPQGMTSLNGTIYFWDNDLVHGYELWKNDGTEAGTVLVKDINPGPAGSFTPSQDSGQMVANGLLFFFADDGVHGYQLWKTDGTAAGTTPVKDSNGTADVVTSNGPMIPFGNGVIFAAGDSAHGFELWKSDGTSAGTTLIKDLNPGSNSGVEYNNQTLHQWAVIGSVLYFAATDGGHNIELWKTDGSEIGTSLVKDINPGVEPSSPDNFVPVNQTLFFSAVDPAHGNELWKTDGSEMGTSLVKDINPGPNNASPGDIFTLAAPVAIGTSVYFPADDGVHGRELWKSDGTEAGTALVQDIAPGSETSAPAALVNVGGKLFFSANDRVHGREVWVSDGTEATTNLVKDIEPNTNPFGPPFGPFTLINFNGTLIFSADDGVHGEELWRSDGTAAGTALVADVNAQYSGSNPGFGINLNGVLIFSATDGVHGYELWRSDGTAGGTQMVKDIVPGSTGSIPYPEVVFNNILFFATSDGTVWKTDGTAAGTVPFAPAKGASNLTVANGALYFTTTSQGIQTLWKSNGTDAGTIALKSYAYACYKGGCEFPISSITASNTAVYFAVSYVPNTPPALWKTDGTVRGTVLVKNLDQSINWMSNLNGKLIFGTAKGLWLSTGTSAVTTQIRTFVWSSLGSSTSGGILNGRLFFWADDGVHGIEPWATDGTNSNTALVKDIAPGSANTVLSGGIAVVNGRLFFNAYDGVHGLELWSTDGTTAGTQLVADLNPGAFWSDPSFVAVGDALVVMAFEPAHGREAWHVVGSTNTLSLLFDFVPGPSDSNPSDFTQVGSQVFFSADDPVLGRELWVMPLDAVRQRLIMISILTTRVVPSAAQAQP